MDEIDYNAPSKVKNAARKVKVFAKEHKNEIITGGVCLVVGAVATCLLKPTIKPNIAPTFNTELTGDNGVINNIVQTVIQANFGTRGRPGHMIQHLQTGRMYGSIKEAAEELNLSDIDISRNLRGLKEHVKGNTFVKLIKPDEVV